MSKRETPRWVPYAGAAMLLLGVFIIVMALMQRIPAESELTVFEGFAGGGEVSRHKRGETLHFQLGPYSIAYDNGAPRYDRVRGVVQRQDLLQAWVFPRTKPIGRESVSAELFKLTANRAPILKYEEAVENAKSKRLLFLGIGAGMSIIAAVSLRAVLHERRNAEAQRVPPENVAATSSGSNPGTGPRTF